MPLSRLLGYYGLLLLLCSVVFARWLPTGAPPPEPFVVSTEAAVLPPRTAPLVVSLRLAPGIIVPGKS